jgi:hypothetical protein
MVRWRELNKINVHKIYDIHSHRELDARTLRTGKPFWDMIGTHWEKGGGGNPCPCSPSKRKKLQHSWVRADLFFVFLPCSISAPAISRGQIWWPTVLKTKNTCGLWVGWSMHSKCLDLFSFKFCVARVGGGFFSFFLCSKHVPSSSQWVPIKCPNEFPMCSQRVFLIARCINPICFAQSYPLLTYIHGPKGTFILQ